MDILPQSPNAAVREHTAVTLIKAAASLPPADAQEVIDRIVRLSVGDRSLTGTVHTMPQEAALMCRLALREHLSRPNAASPPVVLDPACGSGVFLVQMLRAISEEMNLSPDAAASALRGTDISPVAIEGTRYCLAIEAGYRLTESLSNTVRQADALLGDPEPADIVIGNPPYVRNKNIPAAYRDQVLDKLTGFLSADDIKSLTGMSDLYVYFILKGLSTLNERGVLCFLVPNAWLDTIYGQALRNVLARKVSIKAVYDFSDRRIFSDAAVNSCIILARKEPPRPRSTTLFCPISKEADLDKLDGLPGTAVSQRKAFTGRDGCGIYLRAPDIYHVVIKKAAGKVAPLGRLAEVRRGITTGANEFFYPSPETIERFGIEPEYLFPLIKSPRECGSIVLNETHGRVFLCHLNKESLQGSSALDYIEWGESQGFHLRPTCSVRPCWWMLPEPEPADIVWVKAVAQTHRQCRLDPPLIVDQRLYSLYSKDPVRLNLMLNSALVYLFREVHGRTALGEGALDSAVADARLLPVPQPDFLEPGIASKIESRMARRAILPVANELSMPDRRELDLAVFKALGLTEGEGDAVCEEVIRLAQRRLQRARSITG